jgi:hypothetical protein
MMIILFNGFEKPKAGGAFFIFLSNWQKTKIEARNPLAYNVGGMVSCRMRATLLSNYRKLQAGGDASN